MQSRGRGQGRGRLAPPSSRDHLYLSVHPPTSTPASEPSLLPPSPPSLPALIISSTNRPVHPLSSHLSLPPHHRLHRNCRRRSPPSTKPPASPGASSGDRPPTPMHSLSADQLRRRLLRRLRRLLAIPRSALRFLPSPSSYYGGEDPTPFLHEFTGKEIRKATSGFSAVLGSDSHGAIYQGRFPDGVFGLIRKVRFHPQDNKKKFHSKVQLLSRLHHRHIAELRGFSEGPDRFLVFENMENGSLWDCLHDPLRTPLNWRTRLQIAISIAAALEYLQFFCEPPVYNVSVDSTNVYLDENFVAKLCDVGLLYTDRERRESQIGLSKGHTRRRHLIFEFGVLILELVTGQSFESEAGELIEWVQGSNFGYSLHRMVDADLGNSYDGKELRSLLTVARFCTRTGDKPTVSIRQILRYLQRKIESGPSAPQSQ